MNDWISVEERLPKHKQYILVFMDGAMFSGTDYAVCGYDQKYGFDRARVTHWQPLPEPLESK